MSFEQRALGIRTRYHRRRRMYLVEGGELTVNGAYALYAVGAGSDIGWLLSECGI